MKTGRCKIVQLRTKKIIVTLHSLTKKYQKSMKILMLDLSNNFSTNYCEVLLLYISNIHVMSVAKAIQSLKCKVKNKCKLAHLMSCCKQVKSADSLHVGPLLGNLQETLLIHTPQQQCRKG